LMMVQWTACRNRSGQRPFARQSLYMPAYTMATTAGFCIGGYNASGDGRNYRVRTAVRTCNAFCLLQIRETSRQLGSTTMH
jgi:hypothetical protein